MTNKCNPELKLVVLRVDLENTVGKGKMLGRSRKHCGKGQNTGYQPEFSAFPTLFSKISFSGSRC